MCLSLSKALEAGLDVDPAQTTNTLVDEGRKTQVLRTVRSSSRPVAHVPQPHKQTAGDETTPAAACRSRFAPQGFHDGLLRNDWMMLAMDAKEDHRDERIGTRVAEGDGFSTCSVQGQHPLGCEDQTVTV